MGILEGRTAVVTGASRGIGVAIARRLAAEGAAVAVSGRTEQQVDDRLPGTIHATVAEITNAGGRAIAVPADLTNQDDRRRLISTAERELGPVDILVNNAAVTWFIPVDVFPESKFRVMFEVQVRAPFELAQLVLPGMRERKRGWILNISSRAAIHPPIPPQRGPGGTVYGMVKAAIERFSTGLASEEYSHGIMVNALSPTQVVATPGVLLHRLIPEGREDMAESVEVMADAALALCSRDITGRVTYSQEILTELGAPIPGR